MMDTAFHASVSVTNFHILMTIFGIVKELQILVESIRVKMKNC